MSILLSKIPDELADKCSPFKFDYSVLEFSDKDEFTSEMSIELVETLQGKCFLVMDNVRFRSLHFFYDEAINLIKNYLLEFEIDIDKIEIFHLSEHRTFSYDSRLQPIKREPDFINFLKQVGIYAD
jgi:hypothetical protein